MGPSSVSKNPDGASLLRRSPKVSNLAGLMHFASDDGTVNNGEKKSAVLPPGASKTTSMASAFEHVAKKTQQFCYSCDQEMRKFFLGDRLSSLETRELVANKARTFVREFLKLHKEIQTICPWGLNVVADNFLPDLHLCVRIKRLLNQQLDLQIQENTTFHVDVGFHYTRSEYCDSIASWGLLTKEERDNLRIKAHNGSVYGDEIYSVNDPYSSRSYIKSNAAGILLLRLQGRVGCCFADDKQKQEKAKVLQECSEIDTIRVVGYHCQDTVLLKKSSYCLALMQYPANMVVKEKDDGVGNQLLFYYQLRLQKLVDQVFNGVKRTCIPQRFPSDASCTNWVFVGRSIQRFVKMHFSSLPVTEAPVQLVLSTNYKAPSAICNGPDEVSKLILSRPYWTLKNEICGVCLGTCSEAEAIDVVSLVCCGHEFHRTCLQAALQQAKKCPLCRIPVGVPRGTMPSGAMHVFHSTSTTCQGHDPGAFILHYSMNGGTQQLYHPNPGIAYGQTQRHAYLPNNAEGRMTLSRLVYAFAHGLTFTVGTSLTTGQSNVITWASIPHKTSTRPGPHGFPDFGYFLNVHEDLDALGVPPVDNICDADRMLCTLGFVGVDQF